MRAHQVAFIISCVIISLSGCSSLQFSQHQQPVMPPQLKLKEAPQVAYVLGAGGVKGIAHIGVIEALEEHGIKPDLIVGCSAGAIVGALYADYGDIKIAKERVLGSRSEDILGYSIRNLPYGIVSGKRLGNYLEKNLFAESFKELSIPLVTVATNLEFGNLTKFSVGPIIPAVRASSAYPGAFTPQKIEGQWFVDGAVSNPIPVQVAKEYGAKYIIAIDISEAISEEMPTNLFGIMKRATDISYTHMHQLAIQGADYVVHLDFKNIGTFTDDINEQLYLAGQTAGQKAAPKIKAMLKQVKIS